MGIDALLLRTARTRGHTPLRERRVELFSRLGEHGAIWIAIGLVGERTDRARRAGWRRAGGAVAGAFAANVAVKQLVGRPRPQLDGLPALTGTPTALSFPSTHTATGFAGALAYSRMGLPAPLLYALAASLSLSRLYLGVHYPSDLLAGALLGTAVAAAVAPRPGAWA